MQQKLDNGNEGWPGIFSRFQLIILAGRRSKQLFNGAQPRIPVDPLKRRNTSIALEEIRRGLVAFKGENGKESHSVPVLTKTIVSPEVLEHGPDFKLPDAE
jgi:DNA-directed RNA polymerase omega subunit